jgi:hypothetical protein
LNQHLGWRSVFWVNVPVGLLAVALLWRSYRDPPRQEARRFDLAGPALGALSMTAVLLALEPQALPVPAVPAVPPYQAAMDALARLRASGLIADGKIKEFYIALSDIIRDYLAAVYGIELRDKTSAELYAALKGREPDRMVLGTVKDFFDGCDLVKFAKYRPEAAVCDRDWDAARKIVEG